MGMNSKQTDLFSALLINETAAFWQLCVDRDQHDFWAPNYLTLQAEVDTCSARLEILKQASTSSLWR